MNLDVDVDPLGDRCEFGIVLLNDTIFLVHIATAAIDDVPIVPKLHYDRRSDSIETNDKLISS